MSKIDLTKERYELVTHRQEYHADRMHTAFAFYIKVFTSLVVASFVLASTESPLKLQPEMVPLLLNTIAALISLVGGISITQIVLSLISWKGFREAESKICEEAPPVPRRWWLFETLYCIIIIISIIVSWCGVKILSNM